MTTKFTPGPWHTGEPFAIFPGAPLRFHVSQAAGAPYTPNYSDVANLSAETIPGEKLEIQRANARLIAAAPDLLEALRELYESLDSCVDLTPERMWKARAAITKATGEQQ